MLRTVVPAPFVEMHAPPDADIFLRLHPAHVAQPVRLVEVEQNVGRSVEPGGIVRDQDRAPGRGEGRLAPHLPGLRGGGEPGAEALPLDPLQPEGGIVDQRGLVDRDMQAVCAPERDRRVRGPDLVGWGMPIKVFVSVPLAARDPPGFGIAGKIEFGQFLVDAHIGKLLLVGKREAETDAAIEDAGDQVDPALRAPPFADRHAQFAIIALDHAVLAPGLFPLAGMAAPRRFAQRHAVLPLARAAQHEAQRRRIDHRLAVAGHGVARHVVHGGQREAKPGVGRTLGVGDCVLCRCSGRTRRGQADRQQEGAGLGRPRSIAEAHLAVHPHPFPVRTRMRIDGGALCRDQCVQEENNGCNRLHVRLAPRERHSIWEEY